MFCALYAVVAVQEGRDEHFPIFNWDLFSHVPSPHGTDYSVRLLEAPGFRRPLPAYYEDLNLQPAGQEVQGYFALQELGKTLEQGDAARAEKLRRTFESTYLNTFRQARYEVVKRTYDIRARLDCRTCFADVTVLAPYTIG